MCSVYRRRKHRADLVCENPDQFQCSQCGAGLCVDHTLSCDGCELLLCFECEPVHALVHELEELLRNGNLEAGGEA